MSANDKPQTEGGQPERPDAPSDDPRKTPTAVEAAADLQSAEAQPDGERPETPEAESNSRSEPDADHRAQAVAALAPRRQSVTMLVVAAIIGGVIATVLGIAYHASGLVPTRSETVAQDALTKIDGLTDTIASFESRVAALEAQVAATPETAPLTAAIADLRSTVAANAQRIDQLEAAPQGTEDATAITEAIAPIEARLSKLEATGGDGDADALAGLSARIGSVETAVTDLETQVASLADQPSPGAESERAARAIAIGLLQQAAHDGGPFATDLAALKALGTDTADVAALEPLASKDTPSLATLQAGFPTVADAILEAGAGTDDAGIFDRLAGLGGLVTVRPIEPMEGETSVAIVSRMRSAVDQGDLATALSERDALPPEGQAVSSAWAAAATDRVAINSLVEKLALSMTAAGN
ncbi:hypothetical protein [Bauldia sp.]|uniref:hypothetical protein n=1 Tax=Bauldia sp. TaxID=2575872 RepID=UPI003BABD69A